METEYKTLATEFVKSGFRFRQIIRENQFAIFHKVALKGGAHATTFDAGFEVVVIANHPAYEMGGVQIPAGEAFPSPEQWGSRGWTYTNLLAAEQKFESLLGKKAEIMPEASVPEEDEPETVEATPIISNSHRGRAPKERIPLNFPPTDFSVKDLAEFNKVEYGDADFFIKQQLASGSVKFLREERRAVKGKLSKIFAVVKTT